MNDTTQSPPGYFKVVAIIALIWNLIGVAAFAMFMVMLGNPEAMAQIPEAQRAIIEATPAWANAAYGTAVIAGALGSLMLLLRKNLAEILFIISLAGILVQDFHAFVVADGLDAYGGQGLIMPALVLAVAIYLLLLARKAKANGWSS